MTKLEKLQKEYPMFELEVRPTSNILRECLYSSGEGLIQTLLAVILIMLVILIYQLHH